MDDVKHRGSRSYGQFCGLARALDVVGDRWNLLIVRELLPGPLRYSELKTFLAGIATNLLAARLRTLEENGIVARQLGDTGVLYGLTPWGAELREPMEALGRVGRATPGEWTGRRLIPAPLAGARPACPAARRDRGPVLGDRLRGRGPTHRSAGRRRRAERSPRSRPAARDRPGRRGRDRRRTGDRCGHARTSPVGGASSRRGGRPPACLLRTTGTVSRPTGRSRAGDDTTRPGVRSPGDVHEPDVLRSPVVPTASPRPGRIGFPS